MSTSTDYFDLEAFLEDVWHYIVKSQKFNHDLKELDRQHEELNRQIVELYPHREERQRQYEELNRQSGELDRQRAELNRQLEDRLPQQAEARNILNRKPVLHLICPTLLNATDDVFDIAKLITPILVGAVLAGTIAMALEPPLFAAIALVIARKSAATLCDDYDEDEQKDKN